MAYRFSFRNNLISFLLTCCLFSVAIVAQGAFPTQRAQQPRHDSQNIPVERIIALAPNITELVFAAGAGEKLVGVTRYSDYPQRAKSLPVIGDFSGIDFERVLSLNPDLVIAWASGNRAADIAKIRELGLRVFLVEPSHLQDISKSIREIGNLAGTEAAAQLAADGFDNAIAKLSHTSSREVKVFYQIWNAPLITINANHIISDIVTRCGGVNIFADVLSLTTVVSLENVLEDNPDVILISNSSLQNGLALWQRFPMLRAVTYKKIYEISPDLIQRHSPRILEGAKAICAILATGSKN